jgi:hypothetical protein
MKIYMVLIILKANQLVGITRTTLNEDIFSCMEKMLIRFLIFMLRGSSSKFVFISTGFVAQCELICKFQYVIQILDEATMLIIVYFIH